MIGSNAFNIRWSAVMLFVALSTITKTRRIHV